MTIDELVRCAPIIYLDEREPFPPTRVGYSIIAASQPSPSFQRVVEIQPPAVRAIEYAIWFDWDIGHLYDLEHVWVYLNRAGQLVQCEGSWHGYYNTIERGGIVPLKDGHPVVYSEPGKHAFASSPTGFDEIQEEAIRECTVEAGEGGLLITHLYLNKLHKSIQDDLLIRQYLQRRAFTPSWNFTKHVEMAADMLMPWPELDAYIPPRVEWWLQQLRQGFQ